VAVSASLPSHEFTDSGFAGMYERKCFRHASEAENIMCNGLKQIKFKFN